LIAREIEVSSALAFHFGSVLTSSDTSEGGRRVFLIVDMNRILLRNGAARSIKENGADFPAKSRNFGNSDQIRPNSGKAWLTQITPKYERNIITTSTLMN
jgi:hypothetical protein